MQQRGSDNNSTSSLPEEESIIKRQANQIVFSFPSTFPHPFASPIRIIHIEYTHLFLLKYIPHMVPHMYRPRQRVPISRLQALRGSRSNLSSAFPPAAATAFRAKFCQLYPQRRLSHRRNFVWCRVRCCLVRFRPRIGLEERRRTYRGVCCWN